MRKVRTIITSVRRGETRDLA